MNPIIERDIHSRQEYSRRLEDYRRQMRDGAYPEKPKCRQRIVQDVTMEGICKVLEDNPAGLCFFCDELIGWLLTEPGLPRRATYRTGLSIQPLFTFRQQVLPIAEARAHRREAPIYGTG